ncbi:MAG: hypothetical protein OXU20_02285 [Myxococcales bacterium]|nr:hypothetical protein [Myxococcales bacterium]
MGRASALSRIAAAGRTRVWVLVSVLAAPANAAAQAVPDYLADTAPTSAGDEQPALSEPTRPEPSYRGMLAAGYLLAIPSAAMTGGVGLLLPVGMHYHHHNETAGLRALFGILGGIAVGGVVGALAAPPQGGFQLTPGMAVGMTSGFFLWGALDVAFFGIGGYARENAPGVLAWSVDVRPDGRGVAASVGGRI